MVKPIRNLNEIIKSLLGNLDDRQRDVVERRYGLQGGEPATLAAIGEKYDITRERVRQIEALALSVIRKDMKKDPGVSRFLESAWRHLRANGGFSHEQAFFSALKQTLRDKTAEKDFPNQTRLVLEAAGGFEYSPGDEAWHPYWYLEKNNEKRAKDFVVSFSRRLGAEKEAVLAEKKFNEFLDEHVKAHDLTNTVGRNYIAASRKFAVNQFGDIGLSEWIEIDPRTARDWAYLVLKKGGQPMHFTDLAKAISKLRTDKRTNPQTVHNELIKDPRFMLVGRGIYGLRDFGILPGTAREVISHFLKKHGPLRAKEVVKLVLEERPFKENTVLINLQNKQFFASMPDGRYCLKEA